MAEYDINDPSDVAMMVARFEGITAAEWQSYSDLVWDEAYLGSNARFDRDLVKTMKFAGGRAR